MFSFHIEGQLLTLPTYSSIKYFFTEKDFSGAERLRQRKLHWTLVIRSPLPKEDKNSILLPGLGEVFCQGDQVRCLI